MEQNIVKIFNYRIPGTLLCHSKSFICYFKKFSKLVSRFIRVFFYMKCQYIEILIVQMTFFLNSSRLSFRNSNYWKSDIFYNKKEEKEKKKEEERRKREEKRRKMNTLIDESFSLEFRDTIHNIFTVISYIYLNHF